MHRTIEVTLLPAAADTLAAALQGLQHVVGVARQRGASVQPMGPISAAVYETVRDFDGTISAEHGIGLLKKSYLGHTRSPQELALMRRLKAAMDPQGILNPGKVFDMEDKA